MPRQLLLQRGACVERQLARIDRGRPSLASVTVSGQDLREIAHYLLTPRPVSRSPRLENRRLGFEPLC
jgi:hypothetical protein